MRPAQKILITLTLVGGVLCTLSASPFANQVIRAQGSFGASVYGDTNAVLGAPATRFYNAFPAGSRRVKLVEAAYNIAADTNGLITPRLLLTLNGGGEIIVRFDQPVVDRPANPYGVDFIVFGNTFFTSYASPDDSTDMNVCELTGLAFDEPLMVSVSPGYTGQLGEDASNPGTWPWYRYENGPYGDAMFPTQAYWWNRAAASWSDALMDFTKPVNPAMQNVIAAGGLTAADAIDLYAGSGGGTGFDLAASGFAAIRYVKVEGLDPGFSGGEIDALAGVRPMAVGDALTVTPENILSNTASLYFQKSGASDSNEITLTFTSLDGIAQVATSSFTNFAAQSPLPGTVLTAVQLNLAPLLAANPPGFSADLKLSTGAGYSGNGSDLLLLQAVGTNWSALSFSFLAASRQVQAIGLTNLSVLAVVQIAAPPLSLKIEAASRQLAFTPLPELVHVLECSTNLMHWTAFNTFTASNTLPVVIIDSAPITGQAFYRLKVQRP